MASPATHHSGMPDSEAAMLLHRYMMCRDSHTHPMHTPHTHTPNPPTHGDSADCWLLRFSFRFILKSLNEALIRSEANLLFEGWVCHKTVITYREGKHV